MTSSIKRALAMNNRDNEGRRTEERGRKTGEIKQVKKMSEK